MALAIGGTLMTAGRDAPTRLARRLGTTDAVLIGLGAMIGAGVFAAVAPAAGAAGTGLLIGLVIAAFVAYCNATSSAQLAAVHPESGGTYVYGRKRLNHYWGFLAGWGFVVGKLASCAAMALTFAYYAAPDLARPLAIAAVVGVTTVNYLGIRKTALVTRGIVALVLAALALAVAASLFGGQAEASRLWPPTGSPYGILQSAGFLFFAFAGYARLATLGEEVKEPAKTIPRAVTIALGITLLVYATVMVASLMAVGADRLAASPAPLIEAVKAGSLAWLAPVVQFGAAVASLGVLLSLVAGVSRTAFSMAAERDLPHFFAAVHPKHRVPHHAELAVGVLVAAVVAVADVRQTIGFSSFAILVYYAIANASALKLDRGERRWPAWLAWAGLVGCLLVAVSLPWQSVAAGAGVLAVGSALFGLRRIRPRP